MDTYNADDEEGNDNRDDEDDVIITSVNLIQFFPHFRRRGRDIYVSSSKLSCTKKVTDLRLYETSLQVSKIRFSKSISTTHLLTRVDTTDNCAF